MSINIHQLPIPDWGLVCPNCSYPLRGLPKHRCPECGEELNMNQIVKPWTRLRPPRFTGQELPFPDFGLGCWECDQPLAGATTRACPACGKPFDPEQFRPQGPSFVVDYRLCGDVPLVSLQSEMTAEQLPHMISREQSMQEIYVGAGRMLGRLAVPIEFYFETLSILRRLSVELEEARRNEKMWTCPKCRSLAPGNFGMCWQCETPRPADA